MIPDFDIYLVAGVTIKHHGEGAPTKASTRADAWRERGDPNGHALWKRIQRAVEELQKAGPKSGEAVH
jgi:hypothetical protein